VIAGMNAAAEDEDWNCAYCDISYDEERSDREFTL